MRLRLFSNLTFFFDRLVAVTLDQAHGIDDARVLRRNRTVAVSEDDLVGFASLSLAHHVARVAVAVSFAIIVRAWWSRPLYLSAGL